jgi:PAS domain S-box-containing protein
MFRNEPPISPYDEIKRKNEQLIELSEKVQKSETEYINLTNSLPLGIFYMDTSAKLLYANWWLINYTGETVDSLNATNWSSVIYADDYDAFMHVLKRDSTPGESVLSVQVRIKHKKENVFRWHQLSLSPFRSEDYSIKWWTGYLADIHVQKEYEQTLHDNEALKAAQEQLQIYQRQLENNISELNRSNYDLQQFAFVASHDLQEPMRKIMISSDYLLERYKHAFDEKADRMLKNIVDSSSRMRRLIHDLLNFSQVDRTIAHFGRVDLNNTLTETLQDLEVSVMEKQATIRADNLPTVQGDPGMLRQLFENIVSNALKFAKKNVPMIINIEVAYQERTVTVAFRDNGIGFDEQYTGKMFDLFQRLHPRHEYGGTGIGLAICRKIMDIHQGKIWANGKADEGASFYVELPRLELT